MKLEIELSGFEEQGLTRLARDFNTTPVALAQTALHTMIVTYLEDKGVLTADEALQHMKALWKKQWKERDE
jgi:hypothetical protein